MSENFLNIRPAGDQNESTYQVGICRKDLESMLKTRMGQLRGFLTSALYKSKIDSDEKILNIVGEDLGKFEEALKSIIGETKRGPVIFRHEIESICEGVNAAIQEIQMDIFRDCGKESHMVYKTLGTEMQRLKGQAQEELKTRHFVQKTEGNESQDNVLMEYSQDPSASVEFIKDTIEKLTIPLLHGLIMELTEHGLIGENEELSLENFIQLNEHFGKFLYAISAFNNKIRELANTYSHCPYEMLRQNLLHELDKFRTYAGKIKDEELNNIFGKFAQQVYGIFETISREDFEMVEFSPGDNTELKKYTDRFMKAKAEGNDHPATIFVPGKFGEKSEKISWSDREIQFCDQLIKLQHIGSFAKWEKKNIKELMEAINNEFHAGYRLRDVHDIKTRLGIYYGEIDITFEDDDEPLSREKRTSFKYQQPTTPLQVPSTERASQTSEVKPAPLAPPVPTSMAKTPPTQEPIPPTLRTRPSVMPPAPAIAVSTATATASETAFPVANATPTAAPVPAPTPTHSPVPAHSPEPVPAPKPFTPEPQRPAFDITQYNTLESKIAALKDLYDKIVLPKTDGEKTSRKSKIVRKIIETALAISNGTDFEETISPKRIERLIDFALKMCANTMKKDGSFNTNNVDLTFLTNELWVLSNVGNENEELIPALGGLKSILDKMNAKIEELTARLKDNEGQQAALEKIHNEIEEKTRLKALKTAELGSAQQELNSTRIELGLLQEEALNKGEMPDEQAENRLRARMRELMGSIISLKKEVAQLESELAQLEDSHTNMHEENVPNPVVVAELEKVEKDRADLIESINAIIKKHNHA